MSFLHLSLATLGGSFVAIPIVLHLLMRRQPKPLQFPALRFVRARKESNQRKLRLRQLALLALRCAVISCLALALARPRVPTAVASNWWLLIGLLAVSATAAALAMFGWKNTNAGKWITAGLGLLSVALLLLACFIFYRMQQNPAATLLEDAEAPVAAALVFDVSPRMAYRHQNQTRLEVAKELGSWVVQQLAFDSDLAILDTATVTASFSVDRSTANKSIDGLLSLASSQDIPQTMTNAAQLLRTSDKQRKEMYVFTDLTAQAWPTQLAAGWADAGDEDNPVTVYILDVGSQDPSNLRLGEIDLVTEYLAGDQPLELEVTVTAEGTGGNVEVQVLLEKQDSQLPIVVDGKPELPELILRGQQQLDVATGESAATRFSLSGLSGGTHHGVVRITSSDGLSVDNERFFTFEVTRTRDVLIATGPGAEASLLTDVLGPEGSDESGQALFRCEVTSANRLLREKLAKYQVIALLDPPPLTAGTWQSLADYVRQGGGLALFLGRNAIPLDQFNSPAAMELLPGPLERQWRAGSQNIYLSLGSSNHRILRGLKSRATTIAWNDFPVFRHWGLGSVQPGAATVLRYGNGQPAILESRLGKGRVLTMTTPISDALNVGSRQPWNMLPTGPNAWPYFVLAFDSFRYLSQSGSTSLNYEIGESATIAHDYTSDVKLFSPAGAWEEVATDENLVSVPFTIRPGHYRLKSRRPRRASQGMLGQPGCSRHDFDADYSGRAATAFGRRDLQSGSQPRRSESRDR